MKYFLLQHGCPASACPSQSLGGWPRPYWNEQQTSTQNIASCTLTWLQIFIQIFIHIQTQYFVPTDSQPLSLPSLWVADCFAITYVKYVELTRLWSGCFHLSVCPRGIAIWLTSEKQRCRTLPKSAFLPGFFIIMVQLDSHGPQENIDRNAPVGLQNGLYPALSFGFTLTDVKMIISASYSRKSQQSDGIPPEAAGVSGGKPF